MRWPWQAPSMMGKPHRTSHVHQYGDGTADQWGTHPKPLRWHPMYTDTAMGEKQGGCHTHPRPNQTQTQAQSHPGNRPNPIKPSPSSSTPKPCPIKPNPGPRPNPEAGESGMPSPTQSNPTQPNQDPDPFRLAIRIIPRMGELGFRWRADPRGSKYSPVVRHKAHQKGGQPNPGGGNLGEGVPSPFRS